MGRFADYVEINPRTPIEKGVESPFVRMEDIDPRHKTVTAKLRRPVAGSGAKFQPGDTLFARITPCLENGKIAQYRGDEAGFGSTEFFVLRAKPGISDGDYVFYAAIQQSIRSAAVKSMTGASGRQRADISALADYECEFPPLPLQHKIAGVLSAYDDLIENNTRRIQILERMAQALYREWFVNFRFPGHERVKLIDSPLGKIPQGWQVVPVPEAVSVNPRTTVSKEGEKPFVPMTSLSSGCMLISDIESREGNGGSKFKNRDTLFARITPCLENGKTAFVQFLASDNQVAFGSTEFIVLRSYSVTPEYVYLLARSHEFRENAIKSMTGATGRQRVHEACFNKFLIAHPGERELAVFTEVVRPMFNLIQCLATKNANLCRTRDLLLPKLISGALDTSNLNIELT